MNPDLARLMKRDFFQGTTRGMRIGFAGFCIAFLGVALGFFGFYVEERWISILGFIVTASGVLVGFVGVIYGWVRKGISLEASVEATRQIRSRFRWRIFLASSVAWITLALLAESLVDGAFEGEAPLLVRSVIVFACVIVIAIQFWFTLQKRRK